MQGIHVLACACVFACANVAAQEAAKPVVVNADGEIQAQAAPAAATPPAVLASATNSTEAAPAHISSFLPAGQAIPLVPDKEWSSATLKQGDSVAMHVNEDVMLDGRVVIPSGTPASGEVIDSQTGGVGGAPGKLSVSAREIHLGDRTIALRSRLSAGNGVGKDRSNTAMAVGVAIGPFALFVHGSDVTISAGTPMSAKLAQDTAFAQTDSPTTTAKETHQ